MYDFQHALLETWIPRLVSTAMTAFPSNSADIHLNQLREIEWSAHVAKPRIFRQHTSPTFASTSSIR